MAGDQCIREDVVLAHHPETQVELFPEAFAAGERVLDAGTTTPSRADYHRAILRVLGVDAPSVALLRELEAHLRGTGVQQAGPTDVRGRQ